MRDHNEQVMALECLRLANGNVDEARDMLSFITGADSAVHSTASSEGPGAGLEVSEQHRE